MRSRVLSLLVLVVVATISVKYGRGALLTCSDYDNDDTVFYIESLPLNGKLVWDGVDLTSSDLPLRVNDTSKTLEYVPVPNSIAEDSFTYACSDEMVCTTESWCVDGWTPYRGKGRTGTVTITITDTPDFPTALNLTYVAYANDIKEISLGFSDPDTGAAPANASIHSLPTVGYLCADSGCAANLTLNSVVQAASGRLKVYYKAPHGTTDYVATQATTSFLYKVTDNTNRASDLGQISITVANPTVATSAGISMNEDTTATIDLTPSITIHVDTVLTGAEITVLPLHGKLFQMDNTEITEVPTTVEDAEGLRVKYRPNPHSHSTEIAFNTWQATNVFDSFNFSAFPDTDLRSPEATLSAYVNPINDAPFVGCLNNLCDFTDLLTEYEPSKGPQFSVNFSDIDPDYPTSQYYRLTILPSEPFSVSLTDPNTLSGAGIFRLGGDGNSDSLLDVIAPYAQIRAILASPLILYALQPATAENPATVEVTVSDFHFFRVGGSQPSKFTGSLSETAVFSFVIDTNPNFGPESTSQSLFLSLGILGGIGGGLLAIPVLWWYCTNAAKKKAVAIALRAAGVSA